MAQRFGRNQRRRAREALQVAQKEAAYYRDVWTRDSALLVEQVRCLRSTLDEARPGGVLPI